jgi:hypothetical protein
VVFNWWESEMNSELPAVMRQGGAFHDAMMRLAYAKRDGKSSLAGGNYLAQNLLELVVAAQHVLDVYVSILSKDDADYLRTKPISRGEKHA